MRSGRGCWMMLRPKAMPRAPAARALATCWRASRGLAWAGPPKNDDRHKALAGDLLGVGVHRPDVVRLHEVGAGLGGQPGGAGDVLDGVGAGVLEGHGDGFGEQGHAPLGAAGDQAAQVGEVGLVGAAGKDLQLDGVGAEPEGQLHAVVGDRPFAVEGDDEALAAQLVGDDAGHAGRGHDGVYAAGDDAPHRLGGVLEAGGDAALAGVIHRDDHGAAVGRKDVVQASLGIGHGGARLPADLGAVNRVRASPPDGPKPHG